MKLWAKRSWKVLILLVALAMAGLELPELFSLNDDVSNDAELLEWSHRDAGVSYRDASKESLKSKDHRCVSVENSQAFSFTLAFVPSVKSGQDLLHFLSLQRK